MLINFDTTLKHFDGTDVIENNQPVTLCAVIVNSLMTPLPEEALTGMQKAEFYQLAFRIYKGGEQEVSHEEAVLIKDRVGRTHNPIAVGQVYDALGK